MERWWDHSITGGSPSSREGAGTGIKRRPKSRLGSSVMLKVLSDLKGVENQLSGFKRRRSSTWGQAGGRGSVFTLPWETVQEPHKIHEVPALKTLDTRQGWTVTLRRNTERNLGHLVCSLRRFPGCSWGVGGDTAEPVRKRPANLCIPGAPRGGWEGRKNISRHNAQNFSKFYENTLAQAVQQSPSTIYYVSDKSLQAAEETPRLVQRP